MSVAEAFVAAGYAVTREWTRETGEPAMMLSPPSLPADLPEVSAIIEAAGRQSVDGYPSWMPLRKLVLVVLRPEE